MQIMAAALFVRLRHDAQLSDPRRGRGRTYTALAVAQVVVSLSVLTFARALRTSRHRTGDAFRRFVQRGRVRCAGACRMCPSFGESLPPAMRKAYRTGVLLSVR